MALSSGRVSAAVQLLLAVSKLDPPLPRLLASFKTMRESAEVSDARRVPVGVEEAVRNARRRRRNFESHFPPGRLGLLRLVAVCQDAFVEPRAIRFANRATRLCRPLYDGGRFNIS